MVRSPSNGSRAATAPARPLLILGSALLGLQTTQAVIRGVPFLPDPPAHVILEVATTAALAAVGVIALRTLSSVAEVVRQIEGGRSVSLAEIRRTENEGTDGRPRHVG